MKTLVVRPLGGLANRMRVIETAVGYAVKHDARLTILWEKNDILNAYYEECFEPLNNVKIINIDCSGDNLLFKVRRKIIYKLFLWFAKLFFNIRLHDNSIRNYLNDDRTPRPEETFFTHVAKSHNKVYLETCYEFCSVYHPLQVLVKNSIKEKVIKILEPYGEFIGVHVRRTDSIPAIENSPIELFIEKMNALLQESPEVKFYISTDSQEAFDDLKKKYGDKIFTAISHRTRLTTEGIVSALIDFYCLSRSKKILGSFYSSFSQMAAKMGNVPLEIMHKNL